MAYIYCYKYEFDNFDYPFRFKLRFKNGDKFKFLNNYYKYLFNPKEAEQVLYCYCLLDKQDKDEAESCILFSNNVLEYICTAPISDKNTNIRYKGNNTKFNIEVTRDIEKLEFISNKILRFSVERSLFKEVIGLNAVALKSLINNDIENAIIYYFKVIEKISKKNYLKFHEKNYTKKVKQNNKHILNNFIKKYFNENLKVSMTNNMLCTSTDELYKNLRQIAYNSIFSKISFFCNYKKLPIDLDKLNQLVKIRNKLAHGDFVDEKKLIDLLGIANKLSNECISLYFFRKNYEKIDIKTKIYDDDI